MHYQLKQAARKPRLPHEFSSPLSLHFVPRPTFISKHVNYIQFQLRLSVSEATGAENSRNLSCEDRAQTLCSDPAELHLDELFYPP